MRIFTHRFIYRAALTFVSVLVFWGGEVKGQDPNIWLETTDGIGQYDYIDKASTTYVHYATTYALFDHSMVWVFPHEITSQGFDYNGTWVGAPQHISTNNLQSINHGTAWTAGASIDLSLKVWDQFLTYHNTDYLNEMMIVDVQKQDIINHITNAPKQLVLQFTIDAGTNAGRELTRLWVKNDGTFLEGGTGNNDINFDQVKLYYETGTTLHFDGNEASEYLYGNYGGDATNNQIWGNDDLASPGGISIPSDGTNKLLCYVVIESFNGTVTASRSAQFKILEDGMSLDGFGAFSQPKKVRIDELKNTTPLTGPINVSSANPLSNGDYLTLADAFIAINSYPQAGNNIIVTVNGSTIEPATGAILNQNASPWNSMVIYPTATGYSITGNLAGLAVIRLFGADKVTIDGRVGAAGSTPDLVISNTSTSSLSGTSTIFLDTDATTNLITYCNVQGSSTTAVAANGGNIFIGDAAVTTGNDNNTISNCNIGPAGSNLPTKGVYLSGSTGSTPLNNSLCTVTNNNIFDYFSAATGSSGIYVANGNTDCSFTTNRFYQTSARTQTTGAQHSAIWLANGSGNNYSISGNTIGYSNDGGSGTYSLSGLTGTQFIPIYLNVGTTAVTNVQSNTIAGIAISGSCNGAANNPPFAGIYISDGLVNIGGAAGDLTGNTIGSMTATDNITFTSNSTTSSNITGIYCQGTSNWITNNNNIGGITVSNTNTGQILFTGIRGNTGNASWVCNNNTIGGNVPNSLNNTSTSANSWSDGIYNSSYSGTFNNNIIRNLTSAGGGAATIFSVVGIAISASSVNHTVSQNTIYNLKNIITTTSTDVYGIMFTGSSGTNLVERNFIYSLTNPSTDNTATLIGIKANGGTTTYKNNIVSLSANSLGAIVNGFNDGGGTNNIYHNTISLNGSSTFQDAAYFSSGTNARNILNNIFANTQTGSVTHNAINISSSTNLTIDYNDYIGTVTGGSGGGVNSLTVSPGFGNASGTALTDYIPSATTLTGTNTLLGTINADIDGDIRCIPTMGAQENPIAPGVATATASPNPICSGGTVTLTGSSAGATTWSWSGPSGFTASTQIATVPNVTVGGTYTLTASNCKGSAAPVSVTITIGDTEPPVAICKDITVFLNSSGTATIVAADVDNGSSDNCAIASRTIDKSTFSCADISVGAPVFSDLIISEYVEGSSNNKAIEIYNGTGSTINLAAGGYAIKMYFNGSVTATTINLTGNVANGATHVLVFNSPSAPLTDPALLAKANQLSTVSFFSGNDAVELVKGTVTLDVIGQIGFDPGTEWGTGLISTADNTLRRNSIITTGDVNGSNVFDPSIEWAGFAMDDFTGLGTHSAAGGVGTPVLLTVTDVNGLSSTCTAHVVVLDNTAPVAVCQNATVSLNASGSYTLLPSIINNGSTDNCGIASMAVSPNLFNCSDLVTTLATDLFISEYVEGSSNNKYIEIYNGTGAAVNLADYQLRLYANGAPIGTPTTTVTLSGTLNNGSTIVYKNASATVYTGTAFANNALNYNGDDALGLYKISTSAFVDIFGRIGEDPGTAWTSGTFTTLDKTLVRKTTVLGGVTVNPAAGFPTLATEWVQSNIDVVTNLGLHSISAGSVKTVVLTVIDNSGNTNTCNALVTIQDITAPVFTFCPTSPAVICTAGTYTHNNDTWNATASDNCAISTLNVALSGATTLVSGTTLNGVTFAQGTTHVIWTATDVNGNISTCIFNVIVGIPSVTTSQVNVSCFGGNNGTATAIPSGGTGPYTYSWNTVPVQTGITATGLIAGTYTITVTDANLCTASTPVTITQPTALDLVLTPTNATCFGGAKSISAAITGTPLSDLQINIDGGAYSTFAASPVVFNGLTAANHIVILRRISDNTCLVTKNVTLTEPTALDLVLTPTNATCFGGAKSISAAITGTPLSDLQINIDGGSFTAVAASPVVFSSLTAANHIIILRRISDNTCLVTKNVTLTEPTALDLVLTPTNATCFGGAKSISAAITGSPLSDLQINIDGGAYAAVAASPVVFNGLTAVNHIIILRRISDNTCLVSKNVTLTEPSQLNASLSGTTSICNGSTTTLALALSGGTQPWSVIWPGGSNVNVTGTSPYNFTFSVSPVSTTTYTSADFTISDANGCTVSFSGSATVTVDPTSVGGTATPAATPICSGSSTTITITGYTGTIQWQQSADGSTGWANVTGGSGATSATYTTPTLTTTTYYRAVLTSGVCTSANSTTALVTVDPTSVGGTATVAASPICSGSSTTITITGYTGTIQWQQSADGSTGWANVTGGSGATTATYITPALTTTTYYRAVLTSGVCTSANSTTALVTVDPTSVGGTATPAATPICSGSSTTITVTGYTGTIQWQQSANGSTGWANVTGGSGATTATYSTPTLTTTTYYRAVLTSGVCISAYSNVIPVTVTPQPSASFSYPGSPFCPNAGIANVTFSGTTGGSFTSTLGLQIDAVTGSVDLAASTPNTYTVTYTMAAAGGCGAATATAPITIKPLPSVNNVLDYKYCPGATTSVVTFTSTPAGSTFAWSNNNTAIGLGASGIGNLPAFTATNPATSPYISTISVIPTLNGCTGQANTFTITVNPTPTVYADARDPVSQSHIAGACKGTAFKLYSDVTSLSVSQPEQFFTQGFEGVVTGWTTGISPADGFSDWTIYSSAQPTGKGTYQAPWLPVIINPGSSFYLSDNTWAHDATNISLTSPIINVGAYGYTDIILEFSNYYRDKRESGTNSNDFAYIQISVNGGGFTTVKTFDETHGFPSSFSLESLDLQSLNINPPYNTIQVKFLFAPTKDFYWAIDYVNLYGIKASSGYIVSWTSNTGYSSTGNPSPTVTQTATSIYTVKYIDNNSTCEGSKSITVDNYDPVIPIITSTPNIDAGICANLPLTLSTNTPNLVSYQWYKHGGIITGETGSSYSFTTQAPSDYFTLFTTDNHQCSTTSAQRWVVINPLPVAAGTITGTATVCQGQTGVTYTVPAITNATGYTWALPTGATITSGANTNTITVSFNTSAVSGNITVYGTNSCGNGTVSVNYALTVNPLPVAAGTITGTATVCQGQTGVIYTVPAIANATGYTWTLPAGATITAGANTNNITVSFDATVVSGNITVYGTNSCGNGTVSANYALTVNPVSVGGTIAGAATVCSGTNSTILTLSGNTGNVVRWESSLDNFATAGTPIVNNTNTLTATNIAATTSFRAVVQSGVCNTANSAIATVTVNPVSVGGTIAGAATVCSGTNSTILTLSGNTGNVVRWESSLDNFATAGTPIVNNTNTLTAANIAATTSFRAVVQSGVCSTANSATATVTVNPVSVGGTITGAATVCSGTNSTTLTLSGNTGNVVRWESSLDNFATAGTPIANITNSLIATNLIATTSYRAVVQSGVCSTANSSTATVTVNHLPTFTAVPTNVLCYGGATGAITITTATGTEFSRDNGVTFVSGSSPYTFSGLAAGTYNVVVKDANTCTTVPTVVTITQPTSVVNASISSQTNVLCFGQNTGIVIVAGTGGVGPYTYAIDLSTYQASGSFINLAAGSYVVHVKDANGCIFDQNVTITQPASAVSASIITTNVSCNGLNTGSIDINASGGENPYTYSLDAGAYQSPKTFNNLSAGTYIVHIKDKNDCIYSQSVTITQASPIVPIAGSNSVVCAGSDLNLTGSATGGTGSYTYGWTGPNSFSSTLQNPSIPNATTAATGPYILTVKDANGCSATKTINVIINPVPDVIINPIVQTGFVKKATGETVIYTFTITNTGAVADIFDLSFFEVPDPGFYDMNVRFLFGGLPITFTPSIPAGGTFTFQVELTVQGNASKVLNHTQITATSRLCTNSKVTADIYTYEYNGQPPDPSNADVEVTKTASVSPASAIVGVPFTYTITAVNNSTVANATNVLLSDQVPASLTITDNAGGTQSGNTISWFLGNLSKIGGGINTVVKVITVVPTCSSVPSVTNNVAIASTPPDVDQTDNTFSLITPVTESVIPVALCKTATINLDASGHAILTTTDINNGSYDNCGTVNLSVSPSSFTCANIGDNSVTLTATDPSGNTNTCTTTVTVKDVTPPSFTYCPTAPSTTLCANLLGTYTMNGTGWDATANDACGVSLLSYALSGATSGTGTSLNGVAFNTGLTTITWTAKDASNNSSSCSFSVTINPLPAAPGSISGPSPVCQGQTGVIYTIPAFANATGYVWTLPAGASITNGSNTNSITVNFSTSAVSGNVSVHGVNTCGNGTESANRNVVVNPLPGDAGTITGTSPVCQGTSATYTVPSILYATSYVWSLPTGVSITSGANTNSITVGFSTTAVSGNITVYGTNSCGNGTISQIYSLTVNPLPTTSLIYHQ